MVPENNCWGARAVKVPTVRGVQESLQTMSIALPKKTKKKGHGFYEVPTLRGKLGATRGLEPPNPPLAPSLLSVDI